MFRKSVAMLAALSLVTSPALAQASARPLSVQPALQRSAAPTGDGSQLRGGNIVPVVVFALFLIGLLMATGVILKDHRTPTSP
jgi:cytochrome c biogenesis factor